MIDGLLRIHSEIGKGSRFWFDITLPRATGSVAVEMPMTQRAAPIPTGVVWDVLVDFANYARWNEFCPSCEAELELGSPVVGSRAM